MSPDKTSSQFQKTRQSYRLFTANLEDGGLM